MGLSAAAVMTARLPLIGQEVLPPLKGNIPTPMTKPGKQWLDALTQRGRVTTYYKSRNELQYIGMPVGGIGAGMVYLGGDGRLWLWDVFNKNQLGVIYKEVQWGERVQLQPALRPADGANYVEPVRDIHPLQQGFAVRVSYQDRTVIMPLHDCREISFEATYPMATIRYSDDALPVTITLKAYSPFIPLNEDDSGLPATICSFQVQNNSKAPVTVALTGWLENKSSIYTARDEQYLRINKPEQKKGWAAITGSTRNKNWADDNFYYEPDYGNFCIASLNDNSRMNAASKLPVDDDFFSNEQTKETTARFDQPLIASLTDTIQLQPGAAKPLHYVISWYFPNLSFHTLKEDKGRYYAKRFKSSTEVAAYIQEHFHRLSTDTEKWCNTWYHQSTLPYWFLERTFLNISTLATTTAHRFKSGRFYAWEGIGSCAGTCTHVWQYAQAMAHIFPALERDIRERVDLGVGFHEDGHIGFRAEYDQQPAMDGQAGRILGIYREHRNSIDNAFLQRVWPRTKKAITYILRQDRNNDGMVDTQIENTLDAKWPGEIAWLVGLCLAAVKAGQQMADEMNDTGFAEICNTFVAKGKANMEKELFNGEYFIHRPDPAIGKTVLGAYNTCHIDQVYGQSWAFQAGLGRVINKEKTLSALRALWKYNFTMDVGPYLQTHKGARPYALPGEGGMIMNTNPHNDPNPYGVKDAWQMGYFHECMSGFEHQVASHMMAEEMVPEALALTRVIHDRYHAAKRNPFNEVECSDHYARAMASYGTFITACGFEYHGPAGYIRFAPKWNRADCKAAFTTAAGWGSFTHKEKRDGQLTLSLELQYGDLQLQTISVDNSRKVRSVKATLATQSIPVTFTQQDKTVRITCTQPIRMTTNQLLELTIT